MNNDYNKPYWQWETCLSETEQVVSVRMYNPNRIKSNITNYYIYLTELKTYLGDRIKYTADINTFHDGSMCCIIYLNDMDDIGYD